MISVVICSVNKALAAQVKRNIDITIGVPWELVLLDNSVLKKSICEIYNMGAQRAKFDILCFVHEDVLMNTPDWGKLISGYFASDKDLALIGLAGSKYKSKALSGWTTGIPEFDCCNIIHRDPSGAEHKIYLNPQPGSHLQKTLTIDGVFMCCRKPVWESIRFNEALLKGFHLYDIDFSFAVSRKYAAAVTYEIELVHLTSGGDYGDSWVHYTLLWHDKNRHLLPAIGDSSSPKDLSDIELTIKKTWLNRLKIEPISLKNKMRWLKANNILANPTLLPYLALFLSFKQLRKKKSIRKFS